MMTTAKSNKKAAANPSFVPPAFEPVEAGPKGTWFSQEGLKVVAGAYLERDIRFWAALLMSVSFVGVGFWALQNPDYEIEPMWFFLFVLGSLTLVPLIFAVSLLGSVELSFDTDTVTFSRGAWFWKKRKKIPLKSIQKVRLIPRSTTFVYTVFREFSRAKVDLREGSGVTMELALETEKEEFVVATDLPLQKTFYLRYVLVKMVKEAQGR